MDVRDLNREQLIELKQRYLFSLADEGNYAEVLGTDYDNPSWWDCDFADEIVPDDVVFREWEGVSFTEDDFWSKEEE